MKVVHLQISRVVSTDGENLPIFDTYTIKLVDEKGDFDRFIANISVMGYIKKQTKVVKVVEVDDKTREAVSELEDISVYETKLDNAFGKKVEEKVDYKAELEKSQAEKEELLKKFEDLERRMEVKFMADELSVLVDTYQKKYNKAPDKRWGIEKLKAEIDKK